MRLSTKERREQITGAALKIISEKGLREFTVANIAHEVGITDGSIFKHFKNKEEIVSSVLDKLERIFISTIPDDTPDPLDRLGQFFLNRVSAVVKNPGLQSLIFSDQLGHAGGEQVAARVEQQRKEAEQYIQSCLLEASKKQLIRKDLDLEDILILFYGSVMSLIFLSNKSIPQNSLEDRADHVLKTFMSMIRSDQ
jgi:AcrR family transcriptional regulator